MGRAEVDGDLVPRAVGVVGPKAGGTPVGEEDRAAGLSDDSQELVEEQLEVAALLVVLDSRQLADDHRMLAAVLVVAHEDEQAARLSLDDPHEQVDQVAREALVGQGQVTVVVGQVLEAHGSIVARPRRRMQKFSTGPDPEPSRGL